MMPVELLLYADSILSNGFASVAPYTSRRSNSELVASLRSLLESLPAAASHLEPDVAERGYEWDQKSGRVSIPSPDALEHNTGEDERRDLDVTAKFFYVPTEPVASTSKLPASLPSEWTEAALDALAKATGIDDVDTFILSFPGVVYPEDGVNGVDGCDDCDEDSEMGRSALLEGSPLFRAISQSYSQISKSERIRSLGLADFALEPLRAIWKDLGQGVRRPRVDQINLRDCCTVSKGLKAFAAEQEIELLTHADCSDLLPPKTFKQLLSDARERLPTCVRDAQLCVRWVLKYTIVHKTRNVVKDKGYILYATTC